MPTVLQAIASQLADDGIVVRHPKEDDTNFEIRIRLKQIYIILLKGGKIDIGPLPPKKPDGSSKKRQWLKVDLSSPTELDDAITYLNKING